MTRITKWLLVFAVCFALGFVLWLLPFFFPGRSERILETWEFRRGERRVVVTAYAEKNSFVPGAYYAFEAVDGSNKRREIMTFRHDDPVPINKNGIVFVNDNIGYVFIGWKYAVTTDGGSSWNIWSADKDLPGWECCNYELIQDVRIAADGSGRMILNPISERRGQVRTLQTRDYGKHWTAG